MGLAHFDPYLGQFKQVSGAAIGWFRTHLASPRTAPERIRRSASLRS
jgi:hypothetical protein